MTTTQRWARTAGVVLGLTAWALPAAALGLRSQFGEVMVKNLYIGETYSLQKLLNLPLRVVNTSDEPVDLEMSVRAPQANELREGYDTIPSTGWVRLSNTTHIGVAAGGEAVSDVVISIPDDEKLMGRRFMVYLWSRVVHRQGLAAGLEGALLLNIASERPGAEEKARAGVPERLANLNFSILPNYGVADGVPLGKPIDLKRDYKVSIKLINPNDQKVTFRLVPKSPIEAGMALVQGYEVPPNARFVGVKQDTFSVEGNSIGEAELTLQIPDAPNYYGKAWMFVVAADLLEQDIPAHFNYRLLVRTQAKDETGKTGAEKH